MGEVEAAGRGAHGGGGGGRQRTVESWSRSRSGGEGAMEVGLAGNQWCVLVSFFSSIFWILNVDRQEVGDDEKKSCDEERVRSILLNREVAVTGI